MTKNELQQLFTYYTVLARVHYRAYRAKVQQNKPLSARVQKAMFYEAMGERRRSKTIKGVLNGL